MLFIQSKSSFNFNYMSGKKSEKVELVFGLKYNNDVCDCDL